MLIFTTSVLLHYHLFISRLFILGFFWSLLTTGTNLQEASPEPTVISSSGDFTFIGRYKYTGTRDYTAFATVPAGLQFIAQVGGMQQMREYAHTLAVDGARYLSKTWNTSLLVTLSYPSIDIHTYIHT